MKVLKTALWLSAIYCLVESSGVLLPWRAITAYFEFYGYQVPAAEPINVFMIRLFSVLFGMIGIFFIILAQNPLLFLGGSAYPDTLPVKVCTLHTLTVKVCTKIMA